MIQAIEGEVWVPIFREYAISNMGRIISHKRIVPILMRTYKQNRNYDVIHIRINGGRRAFTVHRLVAMVFLKNIDPNKTTVNHENGKDDNRACSLTWMTQSENSTHGVDNGLLTHGSKSHKSKLDETQVLTIKSLYGQIKTRHIAKYFGVHVGTIGSIVRGKSWRRTV
jgi:hypothetical protein